MNILLSFLQNSMMIAYVHKPLIIHQVTKVIGKEQLQPG